MSEDNRNNTECLIEKMELGNLLFGNSRGDFSVDRESLEDLFISFLEKAGFDSYGEIIDEDSEYLITYDEGVSYKFSSNKKHPSYKEIKEKGELIEDNPDFLIYSYKDKKYYLTEEYEDKYYDDLEIYEDQLEAFLTSKSKKHLIPEDFTSEELPNSIKVMKPNPEFYKKELIVQELVPVEEYHRKFENDTFIVRPYYWGDSDELKALPNFLYKPENINIDWYKYPFRDSYSNVKLDYKKLREIIDDCLKSLEN